MAKASAYVEESPRIAAIVLAAGCATRMGSQKVLLEIGGRSLVQRVVDAALGSRAAETIVVVGHEAEAVRSQLTERAVTVVENPEYAQGMSTSLRAGVRAAEGCDGALVLLGDQPFVTSGLLDRLIEMFAETGSAVVRPVVATRPVNRCSWARRCSPKSWTSAETSAAVRSWSGMPRRSRSSRSTMRL